MQPVERQHRPRPATGALFHPLKLRHGRMLADPRQFGRHRVDRPVLHRRGGSEPGRHPGRQRRFGHADLAPLRIDKEGDGERQQRHGGARAVARHDPLFPGLAHRPGKRARAGLSPRQRTAPDVAGPCAACRNNLADQADQFLALRPVVVPRIAAVGIEAEPAEDRRVFHGQVSVCAGGVPFAELPEIAADGAVLAQVGLVGGDVGAAQRIPVDDVEEMLLRPCRLSGGNLRACAPLVRPACRRLRPSTQPVANLARHRVARSAGLESVSVQRQFLGRQQHGGDMLAVEPDRTGAMPRDRNRSPVPPVFDRRPDRIGFGPAARNLAVDTPGRIALDPPHPAALKILEPPQVRDLPHRALDIARSDRFQPGLPASFRTGAHSLGFPRSGHTGTAGPPGSTNAASSATVRRPDAAERPTPSYCAMDESVKAGPASRAAADPVSLPGRGPRSARNPRRAPLSQASSASRHCIAWRLPGKRCVRRRRVHGRPGREESPDARGSASSIAARRCHSTASRGLRPVIVSCPRMRRRIRGKGLPLREPPRLPPRSELVFAALPGKDEYQMNRLPDWGPVTSRARSVIPSTKGHKFDRP